MKMALRIAGVAAVLVGLLWIGQGMGYIHWPETSFMIDQTPWAWRGLALAIVGVGLVWAGWKRPSES